MFVLLKIINLFKVKKLRINKNYKTVTDDHFNSL
jgi:hypothetical protein